MRPTNCPLTDECLKQSGLFFCIGFSKHWTFFEGTYTTPKESQNFDEKGEHFDDTDCAETSACLHQGANLLNWPCSFLFPLINSSPLWEAPVCSVSPAEAQIPCLFVIILTLYSKNYIRSYNVFRWLPSCLRWQELFLAPQQGDRGRHSCVCHHKIWARLQSSRPTLSATFWVIFTAIITLAVSSCCNSISSLTVSCRASMLASCSS